MPARLVSHLTRGFLDDIADGGSKPSSYGVLSRLTGRSNRNEARQQFMAMEKHQLSLPAKIKNVSLAKVGQFPIISVTSFIHAIESMGLEGIFAGERRKQLDQCLPKFEEFWKNFRLQYPHHDVFVQRKDTELCFCIPLMIHGDEGRGLKGSSTTVFQWEPLIGEGTRLDKHAQKEGFEKNMGINYLGDPYCTHFVHSVLPAILYKKDKAALNQLMCIFAEELQQLYTFGLKMKSGHFWFISVGMKGDWPWHQKIAGLKRTFNNASAYPKPATRTKEPTGGICHLCEAGRLGYPFEQLTREPSWKQTVGDKNPAPWSSPPTWSCIPGSQKPSFFFPDLFHVVAKGVEQDVASSVIVTLFDMQLGGSVEDKCKDISQEFLEFCSNEKHHPHLQALTRDLLGFKADWQYPTGSWYKAADSRLLCLFLEKN